MIPRPNLPPKYKIPIVVQTKPPDPVLHPAAKVIQDANSKNILIAPHGNKLAVF